MSIFDFASRKVDRRIRGRLLFLALAIAHLAIVPAFIFVIRIGQPRFFGFFVVLASSMLVLDILIVLFPHDSGTEYRPLINVGLDHRVTAIVLCLGIIAYVATGLGMLFYLMMTIFFSMLIVRSLAYEMTHTDRYTSLALVVIGSSLLMVTQLSSYPFFVRTPDTIYHLSLASQLADSGFISRGTFGRYRNLPVFHVVTASTTLVANEHTRLYSGLVVVALFQVTILTTYALFNWLRETANISLTCAILVGISPSFIDWGTQFHAQSLSFVFLMFFLLLLVSRINNRRHSLLSILFILTWVLTHQLSLLMAISLVGVPATLLYLYTTFRPTVFEKEIKSVWFRFSILVLTLVTYWTIVTQIMREPFAWLLYSSPAAQGVAARGFLVTTYTSLGELFLASIPEIVDKLHYTVWLAVAVVGVWTLIRFLRPSDGFRLITALSFVPAAVFYFPNPAWIPLQGIATITRWGIIALPFVVLMPAIGLHRLIGQNRGALRTGVAVIVVCLLVFLSIGSGMSDPSVTDLAGYEKRTPKYLSSSDLAATDYVFSYTDNTSASGTTDIPHYLNMFDFRYERRPGSARIIAGNVTEGEIHFSNELNVIQMKHLKEGVVRIAISEDPVIFATVSGEKVEVNSGRASKVFDTEETVIYYKSE